MSKNLKKKIKHSLACYLDGFHCYCGGGYTFQGIYRPTKLKKELKITD